MIEYLLTLEYRYNDIPNSYDSCYRTKIDTVGVYKTLQESIEKGNNLLIELEKNFKLNKYINKKERLTENKKLVSNLGYLETPFDFYLKIEPLKYNNFKNSLSNVLECIKNYNEYKKSME